MDAGAARSGPLGNGILFCPGFPLFLHGANNEVGSAGCKNLTQVNTGQKNSAELVATLNLQRDWSGKISGKFAEDTGKIAVKDMSTPWNIVFGTSFVGFEEHPTLEFSTYL